jgi:hypothetical protein
VKSRKWDSPTSSTPSGEPSPSAAHTCAPNAEQPSRQTEPGRSPFKPGTTSLASSTRVPLAAPDGPAYRATQRHRVTGGRSWPLTAHAPIYPKTCSDLISVTGTTPIVAGSGTGAYHGIRGSFPVTLTLNEVEARPCQPSPGAFRAQLITMAGSGTISF